MCELIESFQYEILKRLKEMTSVVVFEYEDVKFIYDKSFKTSDEFKDLCDEYKEKFSKVYEQYYDLESFDLTKVTRVLKFVKNDKTIGYFTFLVYGRTNAEINYFVTNAKFNEAVEHFLKKINNGICEQLGLENLVNIYATSHNQKTYTELYSNCLNLYSVEFYKHVENLTCDVKDKLIMTKKVDEDYFDFYFDKKAFDSDKLLNMYQQFVKEEQKNAETKFSDNGPDYNALIKIVDRNKNIEVGFIGLKKFSKGIVTVAVYIDKKYRGLGLYSYFIKHFDLCGRLFRQEIKWLSVYVYAKNKVSMNVHKKLLGTPKIKTFYKVIK